MSKATAAATAAAAAAVGGGGGGTDSAMVAAAGGIDLLKSNLSSWRVVKRATTGQRSHSSKKTIL